LDDAVRISLAEAEALATRAFLNAGVASAAALSTAKALVAAERDGQKGHGLSRVASYAAQARCGKVRGDAIPAVARVSEAAIVVDAGLGFAYPAIDLALRELIAMAKKSAVALAAVRRSHHFGQAGLHVERLAEAGLVALIFGNTPRAMAFWGGARPMMGTNPVAFAAPAAGAPLVIDLALSVVARGRIVAAGKAGQTIPPDWAFDGEGRPTSDPAAALKGSMAPLGGAKGAALALMVEVLAAALTGSHFGFEASSFLDADGPPPDMGHAILAIDPNPLSGGAFASRMAALTAALAEERGVRAPGSSRLVRRAQARSEGLLLPAALFAELRDLAGERE
jgi:(2R)-3-sulfolactate dehydrogenase (NADP+)